ncbi:hypothetical protein CVT25_005431 [Psilocybe cyanescens]|uniref:Uncharacterized protein n=1 Tax=Psilocybe cyanescens TaxID=93625 RepID=A0A409VQS1_PSICY|nr:hypothetical protein CVT25_005431 [Psilocybe cyanescens]
MHGKLLQLREELILTILEEAWQSPLSASERIHCMTSLRLVEIGWSRAFTLISFKDVHIPSLGYLEHYRDIVRKTNQDQKWAYNKFGYLPSGICRSITIEPQKDSALLFDAAARMANLDHDNLRTLVHINDQFLADDIFDTWTYRNLPKQVRSLELHFVGWAHMKLNRNLSASLSSVQRNIAWAIPDLRRLSIIGGDEEFLRHFLPAVVNQDLVILETDFPVELQNIDFKFGNHVSYTLPAKLEH